MSITIRHRRSRRRILGLLATAPLTLAALRRARAQEVLDPENAQAQSLGYVEDAATVDPAAWSKYEAGQRCANCTHFRGAEGDPRGPCPIFGNKLVEADGWCSAWVAAG